MRWIDRQREVIQADVVSLSGLRGYMRTHSTKRWMSITDTKN